MPLARKNARIPPVTTVDRRTLTPDAGLLLIEALCRKFELWNQISEADEFPKIRTEQLGPRQSETIIAQLLFSIARGDATLAEAATLRHEPLLLRLVGLKQTADEATLMDWLAAQTESSAKSLRRLNARLVAMMLNDFLFGGGTNNRAIQTSKQLDVVIREKGWAMSEVSPSAKARLNPDQLCWRTLSIGPFLCDGLWSLAPDMMTKFAQLKELLETHRGIWSGRRPHFACGDIIGGASWPQLMDASGFSLWTAEIDERTVRYECNFDKDSANNNWVHPKSQDSLYQKYCRLWPKIASIPGMVAVGRGDLNPHGILEDRFLVAQPRKDLPPEFIFARHCETRLVMNEMLEDLNLHRQLSLPGAARETYFAIASIAFNLRTALKLLLKKDGSDRVEREIIPSLIATPGRLSSSGNYKRVYLATPVDWSAGSLELVKSHFHFSPKRRTARR